MPPNDTPWDRYSSETKAAHGALILASLSGDTAAIDHALKHLAMMVHCDRTGELRLAHTHLRPREEEEGEAEETEELRAEVDRTRHIVEAARAWRRERTGTTLAALADAVDAYGVSGD